jgi:hypothetical protein
VKFRTLPVGRKKVETTVRSLAPWDVGPYGHPMRQILAIFVVVVVFAAGTTLAMATGGGNGGNPHNTPGHGLKPGCGPDKTDGVAGGSGRHTGQPPKDHNRGDCPNPPGQQGNTHPGSTSSSNSSSKKK